MARAHVIKIRWTPQVENFALGFEVRIACEPCNDLWVDVMLRLGQRILARDRYQVVEREVDRVIVLSDPGIDDFRDELLWSLERPTLIDATVRLLRGNEVIDEFESYTALRSVNVLRDETFAAFVHHVLDRSASGGWCSAPSLGGRASAWTAG